MSFIQFLQINDNFYLKNKNKTKIYSFYLFFSSHPHHWLLAMLVVVNIFLLLLLLLPNLTRSYCFNKRNEL